MRIFLTGATGVIGRRVVPLLLAAGHEVTAAARSKEQAAALERTGATAREVSLFDLGELRAAVAGHDAIINLATHVPHSGYAMFLPGAWRETDRIRRDGAPNLVDAALGAGAEIFVQESFAPIYADRGDAWIDESAPVRPARYNRSTLDAEAAARRFTDGGGIGIVLRFADFYGQDATQLADMIASVRRGWMPLLGPASSYISSVSHDDAAAAAVAVLDAPAGIYNVTDDEPVRHRDFADALADALGVGHPRLPPALAATLAGSVGRTLARSQRLTNRKLRSACAWAPRYPSVWEGFRALVGAEAPRPMPPPERRV